MGWRPIKKTHSIDAVYWRVRLAQQLLQRHQAWIQQKDSRLRSVLPRKEAAQRVVEIGADGVVQTGDPADDQRAPAMLHYQRYFQNGELDLQLEVNGANLTVTSHSYSQWRKTSQVAHRLFSDVGTALREADVIHVSQLELEYRNVFWWDGAWRDGVLGELLRQHDRLSPKWVFEAGTVWHSDQGWVEPSHAFAQETLVERMFLQGLHGTVDNKPCPLLVVHTTLRQNAQDGQPLPLRIQDAFSNVASIDNAQNTAPNRFDDMHKRANNLLRAVLQPEVCQQIGMTQGAA